MHRLPLRIVSRMSGLPRLSEAYIYGPSERSLSRYNYFFNSGDQYTASEWQWSYGNLSSYIETSFRWFPPSCNGRIINLRFQCCYYDCVLWRGWKLYSNQDRWHVGSMQTNKQDRDWWSAIHLFEPFHSGSYCHMKQSKWRLHLHTWQTRGLDGKTTSLYLWLWWEATMKGSSPCRYNCDGLSKKSSFFVGTPNYPMPPSFSYLVRVHYSCCFLCTVHPAGSQG